MRAFGNSSNHDFTHLAKVLACLANFSCPTKIKNFADLVTKVFVHHLHH